MYTGTRKSEIAVHLSNIPGWRTNRKIVVIESDDWGSVRMSSNQAFTELKNAGIPVDRSHYNLFDSLECDSDLEMLIHTLKKFRDTSDRTPVITGVNIVANPDFQKIKEHDFSQYFFEPVTETLQRYPDHCQVYQHWEQGIKDRLMVPIFHGREHLNVQRWMKALKENHVSTRIAFDARVTGIPKRGIGGGLVPDFQAAFDIDSASNVLMLQDVLKTGLELFEKLYGYKSRYFVPTNGPFNNSLEEDLNNLGVRYINTAKKQREPLGEGKYKTHFRFLGQKNRYGQRYLTRNCFFEPSSSGFEWPVHTDWVNNCLKEIEIAFRWRKPAIISTHRVNYIGFLHPENREKSLEQLEYLLTKMLKRWPDIEFMTSVELGDLMNGISA